MKNLLFIIFLIFTACSSDVVIKPAKFAFPVESVLKTNLQGTLEEQRYSFSINLKEIYQLEFSDSSAAAGKEIRLIRDEAGYYYLTAKDFNNVYVLFPAESGFMLTKKIIIPEANPTKVAFNQKSPYIELITEKNKFLINHLGLAERAK
ncbi:MAG: hypothetical protein CO129_01820 [Ignavibacteriales bacterium CG_4_9_14_3_um_filter_34_10]|nr:MAG: hypothetical protein CO129_01820 [Ignavibacteriales bacterium CG_4_9_14_3_um_filter_34_10]